MPNVINSPLEALVGPLEELEYFSELQRAGDDGAYERLHISLNPDELHPDRIHSLEVFFLNDVAEAFGDEEEEEDAVIAQFMLLLPVKFPLESYLHVMRYCNLVNRLLPVGAFGLSEQDGAVYLRHCLATESRNIPPDLMIEVVRALEYACRQYGPHFESVGSGAKTYDDLVLEFETSGQQIPSVGDPAIFAAG